MPESIQTIKDRALSAFHWWLEGLKLPLPQKVQAKLFPEKAKLFIRVANESFHINTEENISSYTDKQLLSSGNLSELGQLISQLDDISEIEPVIVIEEDYVLIKTLVIPSAPKKDLEAIIGFEIERLTPFGLHQIHYDFYIEKTDSQANTLSIVVCLVPNSPFQTLLDLIRQQTARPIGITAIAKNGSLLPVNLASKQKNHDMPFFHFPFNPIYCGILIVSIVIFLQAPLLRYENIIEGLLSDVNQHRTEAVTLRSEVSTIESNNDLDQFLSNKKNGYVASINLLKELSEALPATTWIRTLSLSNNTLQLQGESTSAAETLAIIEDINYLEKAEFSAPVSNTNNMNKEQFQIMATISDQALIKFQANE